MTTLYFTALVVTYLVNALYFATKLVTHSTARKSGRESSSSDLQGRCCS